MNRLSVAILEEEEDKPVNGLRLTSNDKTQSKDISALSRKYYEMISRKAGEVIPFFVLSKDYDEDTKNFELFIGGLVKNKKLDTTVIPKGLYGKMTIKPKMGFLWGLSIGEAKRYFYTEWLPKSGYVALNMEYEYHTEISKGKNPQIDMLFAIGKSCSLGQAEGDGGERPSRKAEGVRSCEAGFTV